MQKAIYNSEPCCSTCMNLGWVPPEACVECLKLCKEEVFILKLGVGLFADKAIVKNHDGQLKTVPISRLTLIE